MVLDHSFGDGARAREDVTWPGNADDVRNEVDRLKDEWQAVLERVTAADLRWVNVELTKNAAEIGYARFLY
jgi:hypothetical protein